MQERDFAKETEEWAKEKPNRKKAPKFKRFPTRKEEVTSDAGMIEYREN